MPVGERAWPGHGVYRHAPFSALRQPGSGGAFARHEDSGDRQRRPRACAGLEVRPGQRQALTTCLRGAGQRRHGPRAGHSSMWPSPRNRRRRAVCVCSAKSELHRSHHRRSRRRPWWPGCRGPLLRSRGPEVLRTRRAAAAQPGGLQGLHETPSSNGTGSPPAAYRCFFRRWNAALRLYHRGPRSAPVVVKADGLAAGKGVVVATFPWKRQSRRRPGTCSPAGAFGDAGARTIVDRRISGRRGSQLHRHGGR